MRLQNTIQYLSFIKGAIFIPGNTAEPQPGMLTSAGARPGREALPTKGFQNLEVAQGNIDLGRL